MLIKNARFIVTQNKKREIIENKDIKIVNGKIESIGKGFKNDDETIDAKNKIVLPGLINSHTHSPMVLFRGTGDETDLHSWLSNSIVPEEKKMNKKKVYYGSLLSILEKISTGTTCYCDMYSFYNSIIKAVNETGIRCFLSTGLKDHNNEEKIYDEIKKSTLLIKSIEKNKNPLIKPVLALHWTLTCSDKLIENICKDNKKNLPVCMHVSETKKEVEENKKLYGKRPIERLNGLNVLNENFVAIHCVNLSDNEIDILAKNRCKVIHNPASNMKLSDGICPVVKMLKKGICVSLGTDSAASNDNLNMFEEMRMSALLQKVVNSADAITAKEVFDMATVNASKIFSDKIGSIEIGKYADLILINKKDITINPINKKRIISNLVYSFDGRVSDVIVNGNTLIENYNFSTLDKDKILDNIEKLTL